MKTLRTRRGEVPLPTFNPDATYGVVRALDALDIAQCRIDVVQMNVFHLMLRPGSSVIKALGGLHAMSGWQGPITTDSGGFQAYSLIRQDPDRGRIQERGILFRPEGSTEKVLLTPEKSIQLQVAYDADIVVCLDDCTHVDAPYEVHKEAVERTINWARRCRKTFDDLLRQKRVRPDQRPLIFAVIQGGGHADLRHRCAQALLEIGFDGFGFGGWPLDAEGRLLEDTLSLTRAAVPAEFPMHALGVGHPANIVRCVELGYEVFDSALPTRDARRGRLYTFTGGAVPQELDPSGRWFDYLHIRDKKFIRDPLPLRDGCECVACRQVSRAYLQHLFRIEETVALRLATLHNLRFMADLMSRLRAEGTARVETR